MTAKPSRHMAIRIDKATKIAVLLGIPTVSAENGLSIPVTISRKEMELARADEFFCSRRLRGHLILIEGRPDQKSLPTLEVPETRLEGTFDVHSFKVDPLRFYATLILHEGNFDLKLLKMIPRSNGVLRVLDWTEIGEEAAA